MLIVSTLYLHCIIVCDTIRVRGWEPETKRVGERKE